MRIVIQGAGVVGLATGTVLSGRGHQVTYHDPAIGIRGEPAEVCVVATPCLEGFPDDPEWADRSDRVVVRSTLRPDAYDDRPAWAAWPCFATERFAVEEEGNPDKLVWGAYDDVSLLDQLLGDPSRRGHGIVTTASTAALIKLLINSAYVAKVVLMNVAWDAFDHDEDDFESFRKAIRADRHLTLSHDDPVQDGYRGAGGKCLPKDIGILTDWLDTRRPEMQWAAEATMMIIKANRLLRQVDM